MKLRDEMHGAVMRLFGGHVKMQDCHNLGTLSEEVDNEVARLLKIMMEKLEK